MRAIGAAVNFVTGHHVQRKRLVYHRLFQQNETAIRRIHGLRSRLEERSRHSGAGYILSRVCSFDGGLYALTVKKLLLIGHIFKFKLTRRAYRLAVAFFFTDGLAESFAVDLAGDFDEASALLALACDPSSRRWRPAMTSVFSRLTLLSSSK